MDYSGESSPWSASSSQEVDCVEADAGASHLPAGGLIAVSRSHVGRAAPASALARYCFVSPTDVDRRVRARLW